MNKNHCTSPAESIVCLAHRFEAIANKFVFQPMGLSSISMKILKLLRIHGTLTASDMLKILNSTKSNLSQRLNFLEKQGYITRNYAKDKSDKRKITLELTKKGKKMILNLEKRFQKAHISLEEKFSQKELEQHRRFIKKINSILDDSESALSKLFQ